MAVKPRILLVEDDPTLSFVIKDAMERKGYNVVHCADAESGWHAFQRRSFDLCLLDVVLPKMSGMDLAQDIRIKNDKVPIIMLTSKSMDADKIAGFKSGADDYVTKPFNMEELLLRVEVFLRRTRKAPENPRAQFVIGNMNFDYRNLSLSNQEVEHELTQREAELILYFCNHPNQVLKREEILLNVWGREDYFLGRSMDVFITKIRKYLKGQPDVEIKTVHGIGFRFRCRGLRKGRIDY